MGFEAPRRLLCRIGTPRVSTVRGGAAQYDTRASSRKGYRGRYRPARTPCCPRRQKVHMQEPVGEDIGARVARARGTAIERPLGHTGQDRLDHERAALTV